MFARLTLLALILLLPLEAVQIKLYLNGGGDLLVSEYEVLEDRVRYYSLERSAWEEIPRDLVNLEKTRRRAESVEARRQELREEERIEREAVRRARTELHRVPLEDGVYHVDGENIVELKQSVVTFNGSKSRTLLQVLAPVPVVAGKTTAEIDGATSALTASGNRPMFYVRLDKMSRVEFFKLTPKKKTRVVQVINTVKNVEEKFEKQEVIEIFRQQLAPKVYKVWPVEPLAPGEYAVIEYTPGEGDIRVWDFALRGITLGAPSGDKPPVESATAAEQNR